MTKASLLSMALMLWTSAKAADSISFSENYSERVGMDQSISTALSGSFKAAVTYPELGCAPLEGGTPFEITVGGLTFQAPLGTADEISDSQITFFIRDDLGHRVGSITIRRNFALLLVTAGFSKLPASIIAAGLPDESGPVAGVITARIVLGDFQVERSVYFSGRQTVQKVGNPDPVNLHSITLAGAADFTRPQLSVYSPTTGQRLATNTVSVRGTVTDNRSAVAVIQLNGAEPEPIVPSETGAWEATANLSPGTNTLAVWAEDNDGNVSATNKLKVFQVVAAQLALTWDGGGTLAGPTNGQLLELGRGYTITAHPAPTNRFGGWTGGSDDGPFQSPEVAANFIMRPSMALHAAFIPPVLAPLTLEVTPGSAVAGVSNRAPLEIGKSYQATAMAGAGNLFLNWSGFVQSTNPTLRFVMQSNMLIQANFAPNPWLPIAGDYVGLVTEELEDPAQPPRNSGSFALTLAASGRVTGRLQLRGKSFPFNAQTGLDGSVNARVARPNCAEPLSLGLLFDVGGLSGGVMSGLVTSTTIYAGLSGNRAGGDATYAGRYSFRVLSTSEAGTPGGEGAGTILVDARGRATVSGTLGDGTPLACSTLVFRDGIAPLNTPLYGGRGLLQGWLNFATNAPPIHVEGVDLLWSKPVKPDNHFYPGGFLTRRFFMATRYTPPPEGSNALAWSDGIVGFEGGNLPDIWVNSIHMTNNLVKVTDNLLKVSLALVPRTGQFTVSFLHPITRRTLKGKGALLQFDPAYEGFGYPINGLGGGWFQGIIETGFVRLVPHAPEESP